MVKHDDNIFECALTDCSTRCGEAASQVQFLVKHNTTESYVHAADFELFKTAMLATSRIEGFQSIANLSRQVLNQTGDGHFCPIGGYNAEAQKVLLLDTARFKYPPHWVDINLLYKAVNTHDNDNDSKRGFMMLTRKANQSLRLKASPSLVR